MLLDLRCGLENREDKGFDCKSLNKLGKGLWSSFGWLGCSCWGFLVWFVCVCVIAYTLIAFGHSKIIALKQKLNLGTGLLPRLSQRTSKEKKKSNLVLTWDKMYLFRSCSLPNEWRVWAESSVTRVKLQQAPTTWNVRLRSSTHP